ncbi:hypothetical protein J4H92_04005 [Leucobacter weissii]|uniref:Uncharacterized protein n=1 Tax=Leucobacter weissii TaxID=1983706 RepID=A0A939MIB4_9MICO|nr:hypothetical protein [Leucobacter weissii]MBO1901111.1 hypothetical protein [Leucobacter weissii]
MKRPVDLSRLGLARRSRRLRPDAGSTMVTVLIIMMVLTIGGVALAAIAMNTATMVASSKHRTSAQMVVDGAIATQTIELMEGRLACDPVNQQTGSGRNGTAADSPAFTWTLDCTVSGETGTATLQARANVDGEEALHRAVFSYTAGAVTGTGGDITFFGESDVTFTAEVDAGTPENPVDVVIPKAGFVCQTEFWGSITAKKDIRTNGGCTIHGDVTSTEGTVKMSNSSDTITGDVVAGGSGESELNGSIGGSVHTAGPIAFSWSNRTIGGSVIADGDVKLRETRIQGSLTLPASKTLTKNSWEGGSYGSLNRPGSVAAPVLPELPDWFEYQHDPAEWGGYAVRTLSSSGSGPNTCGYFNSWPQTGWVEMANLTQNTILDARACSTLSTNAGTSPDVQLRHNLLILARQVDTTSSKWRAHSSAASQPSLWFVTEDPNPSDHAPTCGSGLGPLYLNHVGADTSIRTMAYSPCGIYVAGHSTFNGQLYGASWSYGGGLRFLADPIGLPGMESESGGGGGEETTGPSAFTLVSSQDMPIP